MYKAFNDNWIGVYVHVLFFPSSRGFNVCAPEFNIYTVGYCKKRARGRRCHHRVVVNKSSGFIGSRFPAGQFWFPVGYRWGYFYEPSWLWPIDASSSSSWSRWRCRPFLRNANVITWAYDPSGWRVGTKGVRRAVVKAETPTHREPTHTHKCFTKCFLTYEKTKVYARGWWKIWFEVYI